MKSENCIENSCIFLPPHPILPSSFLLLPHPRVSPPPRRSTSPSRRTLSPAAFCLQQRRAQDVPGGRSSARGHVAAPWRRRRAEGGVFRRASGPGRRGPVFGAGMAGEGGRRVPRDLGRARGGRRRWRRVLVVPVRRQQRVQAGPAGGAAARRWWALLRDRGCPGGGVFQPRRPRSGWFAA